jgi:carboxyl-terminal processing protease
MGDDRMPKSVITVLRWILSTLVAAALAFLIVQIQKTRVELSGLKVLSSVPNQTLPPSRSDAKYSPLYEIHKSAVIDSVVGIIEGYYVDHGRLEYAYLLDETLKLLKEEGVLDRIEFLPKTHKKRSRYKVWVGNHSSLLGGVSTYNNEDLTMDLAALADLVEKSIMIRSGHDASDYLVAARMVGNALLHSLDPHSSLLSSEQYQDLKQGTEGSFGGLGIVVGIEDDLLTVMKPIPNSPAAKAGIGENDKILAIDNVLTFGVTLDNLVKHMRGLPGTVVKLSVLKPNESHPHELEIRRAVVDVPSVVTSAVPSKAGIIAHIAIDSFTSKTSQELEDAYKKLKRNHPIVAIVLDLRSNPGGLLDQAVEVADLFLDSGDIVSTRGRKYSIDKAYKHDSDIKEPVIVLTNSQTASASEIVAAALQENNRAVVIGEPSFGKGSVQTIFELPAENALKLTIARYYTPNGRSIQGLGINPDIWIQPIHLKDENVNLFGEYRFMTESSLFHALPISANSDDLKSGKSKFKAYYIKNEGDYDLVFDLAKGLIEDFISKNGHPIPMERLRGSYWLASSHKYIEHRLNHENKTVKNHLDSKYGLDWSNQVSNLSREQLSVQSKDIDMRVKILGDRKFVFNGETLSLAWRLRNHSSHPIERLSVYITETSQQISPKEVLIGSVSGNASKSGTLSLPIKVPEGLSRLTFKVGISLDAEPIFELVRDIGVTIKNRKHPEIAYEVRLIEQEGGGTSPQILEAVEQGYFLVSIENQSDLSISDMKFGFVNLSGFQVNLDPSHNESKFSLGKFEKKIFKVPVSAAREIYSKKLIFGLVISGKELSNPIKGNFAVRTK